MRTACRVAALGFWAGSAMAGPAPPPVPRAAPAAAVVAAPVVAVSSTRATSEQVGKDFRLEARFAFDGDWYPGVFTRWCTATGKGTGESITIRFDGAQAIDGVSIAVGQQNAAAVTALEVSAGKITVRAPVDRQGRAAAKLGGSYPAVTVRFAAVAKAPSLSACLLDVAFNRGTQTIVLIHGVPAKAAAAAPAAARAIGDALASCDAAALAKVAHFPVGYDYVGPTDAGAHGLHADATALAKYCHDHGLGKLAGPVPVLRTVGANARVTVATADDRTWSLAWLDGAWKLVAVTGTGPVNH